MLNESFSCPVWTPYFDNIVATLSTKHGFSIVDWVGICSAAITAFMAFATWQMAKAAQKTLEAQNKPYVIVYAKQREDSPSVVQIIIENIGTAPAYDIKFSIPKNFALRAWGISNPTNNPTPLDSGPWIEGINQLAPKQKIVFYWGQYGGIKARLNGHVAKINVFFKNTLGKNQQKTENILDINDFEGAVASTPVSVQQLYEINKIQKTLTELKNLLHTKLEPQSPEATYMWAYLAWKIMEDKGLYLTDIYQYGTGAGLTPEQIQHAQQEALSMLRDFFPEKFAEKDNSEAD